MQMPFTEVGTPEPSPPEPADRFQSGRPAPDIAAGLVGRDRETALIDALIDRARTGESGSLVVRGEPGIGKSALLDYAVDQSRGMVVLSTASVEAEADLAFAGLFGLVRPVLHHLEDLPDVQAAALAGALGLGPSGSPERFLVSAAVLGLLAEAADRRSVLCVVDDAQWLDKPSAHAVVFVARRLRAERVALLFGVRVGDVRTFEASGLPDLQLAPLADRDALALLLGRG